MDKQVEYDDQQLFVNEVQAGDVEQADLAEAEEVEQQCHDVKGQQEETCGDANNCRLNPEMAREARRAELEYSPKRVYAEAPKQRCKGLTWKSPIRFSWIDANKQGDINRTYRSISAATDFKRWAYPDLFTASPPMDALRIIASIAATGKSICGGHRNIMINDLGRAYFAAPSLVPTFVNTCEEYFEEGDEDRCGEQLVAMH